MNTQLIQYVSNAQGQIVSVIVPIELWQQLGAEDDTTYLSKSPNMKQRILEAMQRDSGISLQEVCEKLGV